MDAALREPVKGVDVVSEVLIARPRERVAAFAMDPDNAPAWYSNIHGVQWVTPPPLQVGSEVAFVATFLGRRLAYTYEVAEHAPPERLVMRTAEGPFPMETTYRFDAVGPDRTRVTLRNRGAPSGFARVVAPFMGWAVRRENRKDLERLKALMEDDG